MNVNNSNLLRTPGQSTVGSSEVTKSTQVTRSNADGGTPDVSQDGDGVHLSSLSQALFQALSQGLTSAQETPAGASETGSPERDAQVEKLAHAYDQGSYKPDADVTADAIIKSLAAGNGF